LGLLLSVGVIDAQTVKGRVIDKNSNEPVVGAVVSYGKNGGVITDINGEFSVDAKKAGKSVNVSFLGYKEQKVDLNRISENPVINLEEDSKTLSEVVITGYGKSTREKATGNISTITSETLEQYPGTSVLEVLQGRVAGLTIAKSNGLAGSNTSINIRGLNTPSGSVTLSAGHSCCGGEDSKPNTEPLIIIDGIPFINQSISPLELGAVGAIGPLATLSTSDIERIDVLKDADATAIYGSRGANGVILITTKKTID
jgi:TonB-dependent SusC/RagA subfamily outer membrane receptor